MIKSMTGYGRSQQILNGHDISVEIKSVNHRFFEFSARVPRVYGYLEGKIKTYVQGLVSRGKIDVSISVFTLDGNDAEVEIDKSLVRGYVNALRGISDEFHLNDDLSLSTIAKISEVFSVRKTVGDEEIIWNDVLVVAKAAVEKFIDMREVEGEQMKADVLLRLTSISRIVDNIESRAPITLTNYRERLTAKMKEILSDSNIDEQRILMEAAIYSDKIAVDEEIVRLRSHLKQFGDLLSEEDSVGRKLDFLVQELNREINTIGSKAQDVEITAQVVEIKAEIEKIREQIQNIE